MTGILRLTSCLCVLCLALATGGCQVVGGGTRIVGGAVRTVSGAAGGMTRGMLEMVGLRKKSSYSFEVNYKYPNHRNTWDEWISRTGAKVEGKKSASKASKRKFFAAMPQEANRQWAILLDKFAGPSREALAQKRIEELEQHTSIEDLWSVEEDKVVYVFQGRYPGQKNALAKRDLKRTQMTVVAGRRPYRDAKLMALNERRAPDPGGEYDLRNFPGKYTLQIGFYTPEMGKAFRKEAEKDAAALRKKGTSAYFYHGQRMSILTIGLFSYEEAFIPGPSGQDRYAPEVHEIREKFPYHSANRAPIEELRKGGKIKQRSLLVRIPYS